MMSKFSTGKYIIDVSARWCGPCNRIAPYFETLKSENSDITFIKYDVDVDIDEAREFNIQAMPTFISIHNGKIVERFEGASKDKLRVMVDTLNSM